VEATPAKLRSFRVDRQALYGQVRENRTGNHSSFF